MLQHLAVRLLLPVSITLAVASCQQPSATTSSSPSVAASASPAPTASPSASPSASVEASPTPSPSASPTESASPTASPSESPKANADNSDKIKQLDDVIKENAEYKEMYEATDGVKYITLVSTETCKALNAGVALNTLTDELEKEFDKQKDTIPADKLTKLKEYTGFVVGASVVVTCPEHKDKLK